MKHRMLVLLLSAAMTVMLAACGNGDDGGQLAGSASPSLSESQPPATAPAQTPEPEDTSTPEPAPSEDEPEELPEESPSDSPSQSPENPPSQSPESSPSPSPESSPSSKPSQEPSPEPSSTPSTAPSPEPSQEPSPEPPAQPSGVDLQAFFEDLLVKYEEDYFAPNMAIEGNALDMWYAGLSDLSLKQQVIYQPMISSVVCEIALVEVSNAADVQAVKDIFQTRIDYQVGTDDAPGGAWYPASIEGWKNSSRIVSNGNYIMMIAWENCDQFVADFNALF